MPLRCTEKLLARGAPLNLWVKIDWVRTGQVEFVSLSQYLRIPLDDLKHTRVQFSIAVSE